MRIGIDLGGTKTEVIALDDAGNSLLRERLPTPRGDYAATLDRIVELVQMAEQHLGETGSVGIGIPGTISPLTHKVKNANSTWLNGQDLQGDLEKRLERPVRVANDANCFTVSEAVDGAAAGAHLVFGVILGTGCGGGIAIDGRVHGGGNGVAGEWGHNPLPRISAEELQYGGECYCGFKGCIETFISGTGFERQYRHFSGQSLRGPDIVAQAFIGDVQATAALERYRQQLARSLAHVVGILDPDVIVLGGGMSNVDAIYPGLTEQIAEWVFGRECSTPVVRAKHGDSSGVRGAAWLW